MSARKIAIFYHVAKIGIWEEVDREIMNSLRDSGLLKAASIFVRNECADVSLFEFPTLELIDAFSLQHDYNVLYLHTKGASRNSESIEDWRKCMLHFNVERWRECVAKLNTEYDAVGINVVDSPIRHFQGNFWWATTPHIRKLKPAKSINFIPTSHDQTERHKAEFWVLSKEARVYCPYHHNIDPYCVRNPEKNWKGKKF